ncbi:hypothetical protein BST36_17535 [Mycolicibacterium moriokaense]|uniref:DUF4349 domain-containing protein n=1 Tax=Mycolicibacterium moriokaense TaxID=39691 RepID=A0AAD1M7W7_9MYCO|nr:DUF4349 domain-containing protein [Mycolicibacterium moriokaense]MCV7037392.1 DUF4349 domain-containing protein [Mycolicibacterium moriokaense]ORB21317.1 hypothetical protein BST36_17535 [Mycolicibacterium moriokaense]BBX04352.1 hypothetical protein MMOR_52880 [Mycolicibacterium moriokaense]
MSGTSCSLIRQWVTLAISAIAMLGFVTACGTQSHRDDAPSPAMADGGVAAPEAPPEKGPAPFDDVTRDVIKTASMTISVSNTSDAADKAAVLAEEAGGRVDSRSEDAGSDRGFARTSIVLRVPAAKLDGVVRELKDLGTVQSAETTSEDVTAQRVDLDARIKALQTSVDRLLAIMRDARDPEALISAEDALSQRQADLDSLRAQREALGDQIEYSTVNVTFVAQTIGGPAPKEYQGFMGQVERGWDTMVFVAGNLVLLFGLLLPWLVLLAVVVGLIYGIVRVAGARRPAPVAVSRPAEQSDAEQSDVDVAQPDGEPQA